MGEVAKLQLGDLLSLAKDAVSDALGSWLASAVVELDAKVVFRASRVVAGSHQQAT